MDALWQAGPGSAAQAWCWHGARLVAGYGVASGRASDSPYPAGSISLQAPLLVARGVDLSPYFSGTLNLSFSDTRWQLSRPDARVEQLRWTDRHPPETFSFWRVLLRWQGQPEPLQGLIYWPHPETKRLHQHSEDRLEVLAPWIPGVHGLQGLELGVDPARCRRIRPLRLQARLLEALKFRVLASQRDFFAGFADPCGRLDLALFRRWLQAVEPAALALEDADLLSVLERAWCLYCDDAREPFGYNGDSSAGAPGLP